MFAASISALILGLGASLHCLGMCGPLVMAVPISSKTWQGKAVGITQYHLGKTFTYALLGLVVGVIGISLQTLKWMQILSIITGVLIILFAWKKFIKLPASNKIQQFLTRFSGKSLNKLFKSTIPFKPFFFGMINGLLPCGLIYIALLNSLLAGDPFSSMVAMAFFGVGTIPILTLAKFASLKFNWQASKITPVLVTVVGLLIIVRGMNLGIPYISPKINTSIIASSDKDVKQTVSMDCCHKSDHCNTTKK
ncbi:MAG TPA: sulfite exporter TauE/SafE family protein [Taishania sp.]|nr:sulfite exporter TauE/SafE family protein [Taishania sp.]